MILAIDAGNSQIGIGMIDSGAIQNVAHIHTDPRETAEELLIKLRQITGLYGLGPEDFEGSILSSVVPQLTQSLKSAAEKLTGRRTMIVGPGMKTGLNLRLDEPSGVAANLIAGAVGAVAGYGAPVIVVYMDTATTMTVIDKNSAFRGGAILPGVKLSYGALAAGTSLLPEISILPPKKVVGGNTADAMRSGAVFGTASMIDGMLVRMEEELGYPCMVAATGSLAGEIIPCCERKDILRDPDLVMKGLWILYEKNR